MKPALMLTIFFMAGCTMSVNNQSKEAHSSVTDLIGKTVEYRYGESVYHVTFDSDSTLHWEAIAGDEKGVVGQETYVAEFIKPGLLFISWGEANGINVSQVLDFNEGKVYNHLVRNRKADAGDGKIKIIP